MSLPSNTRATGSYPFVVLLGYFPLSNTHRYESGRPDGSRTRMITGYEPVALSN